MLWDESGEARKSSHCCYKLHRALSTNRTKPFWWPHSSSPLCAQWCRWSTDLWLVCFSPPPPNLNFLHSQASVGRGRGQEGGWRGCRSLVSGDEKENRHIHSENAHLDGYVYLKWHWCFCDGFDPWSGPAQTKTSLWCGKKGSRNTAPRLGVKLRGKHDGKLLFFWSGLWFGKQCGIINQTVTLPAEVDKKTPRWKAGENTQKDTHAPVHAKIHFRDSWPKLWCGSHDQALVGFKTRLLGSFEEELWSVSPQCEWQQSQKPRFHWAVRSGSVRSGTVRYGPVNSGKG